MKKVYLILAIIGFIVPNIFVYLVSVETGNILLWLNPVATIAGMFANKISSAFVVDLLIVVLIFIIWSETEAIRYGIKSVWIIWILTFIFGLAGSFPLFLYLVEIRRHKKVKKEMILSRRHRV
jgi:hypothetical protein